MKFVLSPNKSSIKITEAVVIADRMVVYKENVNTVLSMSFRNYQNKSSDLSHIQANNSCEIKDVVEGGEEKWE